MLTDRELDTLTIVVDCLIPEDPFGPSASQAGVVEFLKKQLCGDYGAGKGMYLGSDDAQPSPASEPFPPPLQRYRVGLACLDTLAMKMAGACFSQLGQNDRIRVLSDMEHNSESPSPARIFFDQVLENTMEGYFSDPIHGGNRLAGGWKMVGFPGCGHDYRSHVGENADVAGLVPLQSIAAFSGAADA